MRLRKRELVLHVARAAAAGVMLSAAESTSSPLLAAVGGAALFFEVFALTHDLAHGALGLPRRANETALALAGLAMFTSGHAMRRMHLAHHAAHLGDDDLEGAPARFPLWQAAMLAPLHAVLLRVAAVRRSGAVGRRWQILETLAGLALWTASLCSGHLALVVYASVAVGLQLVAAVWASHVPHNTPGWLLRAARRLAFTGSPTVLALAFHDAHHAHPTVPVQRLASIA